MNHLITLPLEIAFYIMDHGYIQYQAPLASSAYAHSAGGAPNIDMHCMPDVHFLMQCALVCRRWRTHAQSLLFMNVNICGPSQRCLTFFTVAEKRPDLAAHVVRLALWSTSARTALAQLKIPRFVPSKIPQSVPLTSLSSAPPIELHDFSGSTPDGSYISRVLPAILKRFVNLAILQWHCRESSFDDLLLRFANHIPSLRAIRLCDGCPLVSSDRDAFLVKRRFSEFALAAESANSGYISTLLQSSAYALETLLFESPLDPDIVQNLTSVHAISLRHVAFLNRAVFLPRFVSTDEERQEACRGTLTPLLTSAPRLERLQIETFFPIFSANIHISRLPASLRDISILYTPASTSPFVPEFLSLVARLPNVRSVTLDISKCDGGSKALEGDAIWGPFKKRCLARGCRWMEVVRRPESIPRSSPRRRRTAIGGSIPNSPPVYLVSQGQLGPETIPRRPLLETYDVWSLRALRKSF